MIKLSSKLQNLKESATLAMAVKARQLKAEGKDVINLSIGEPDTLPPDSILSDVKADLESNKYHSYPPVDGYLELKQAICKKFARDNQLSYQPDQVVVSTGAKQTIYNLMQALLDPGDEVLLPVPYWVSYRDIATLSGAKVVEIPTSFEDDFKISPQHLESLITPHTRMFVFSSPSNPSGTVYSKQELSEIAEILSHHKGITIVSDEIYEHINYTGESHSIGSFKEVSQQTVTVNGLSKGFAMTGWRLGYMGAPKEIAAACKRLQGQVTSGANTLAQRAAISAMHKDSKELSQTRELNRSRRDYLVNALSQIKGFRVKTPGGAFYLFPDISQWFGTTIQGKSITSAKDFCDLILEKVHISLVPGDAFGASNCVRFSYPVSKETLKEAVHRIKSLLES